MQNSPKNIITDFLILSPIAVMLAMPLAYFIRIAIGLSGNDILRFWPISLSIGLFTVIFYIVYDLFLEKDERFKGKLLDIWPKLLQAFLVLAATIVVVPELYILFLLIVRKDTQMRHKLSKSFSTLFSKGKGYEFDRVYQTVPQRAVLSGTLSGLSNE